MVMVTVDWKYRFGNNVNLPAGTSSWFAIPAQAGISSGLVIPSKAGI